MNKRGPWSWKEKEFIKANAGKISPDEIAISLERNKDAVHKYMQESGLMKFYSSSQLTRDDKLNDITKSIYWRELQKQFSPDELESIKYHWDNTIKQFRDNIMHTEEIQIVDMIKLQLLMDRLLNQECDIKNKIATFEQIIHDERLKEKEDQDKDMVRNYESQIASLYAATESISKEFRELLKEKQNMFKSLKATREQRIKQIESSKENMAGWYKNLLDDHQLRNNIGLYLEKMRIATQVEYTKLTDFHTYADGSVDKPLLTEDSV